MPTDSLVLPFAVLASSGETLTQNGEIAAALILAEAKRRRLGFLGSSGKIAFVSKMHYPLWLVPWRENSLVLDGLDVFSSSFTYQTINSLEKFLEDVEQGATAMKQFRLSLQKHKKTFNTFTGSTEVKVGALISNRELLSAIFEYIREAPLKHEGSLRVFLVPAKLNSQTVIERARELLNLYNKVESDIMGMDYVKKVLLETAEFHQQMITKEIASTHELYGSKMAEMQHAIEEKIANLEKERDAETADLNKAFEKTLKTKEKELSKYERELQKLELELQKTEIIRKRELRKRKTEDMRLVRLEHKIRLWESKIREAKRRVRELDEFIEKTRKQNENEVEKLRRSYQELIDKERSKIVSLESQRDEEISSKQKEIENLRLTASQIASQIDELVKNEKQMKQELERAALPWKTESLSLVCVPFYIIGYKTGNKTKIRILPPVKLSKPKSISKSLMGFTAYSKIKNLLQPRSKTIERMLNFSLKKRMHLDKAFSEAFHSTIAAANILVLQGFKDMLAKGIEELETKGWIGEKEEKAFLELYGGN